MGIMSIERKEHLFWLGRYCERVHTTCRCLIWYLDTMIDEDAEAYRVFCGKLRLDREYASREEFISGFLFDEKDPNSVFSSLVNAFDNGVVLRDELTGETLAYLQLAIDSLRHDRENAAPLLKLQPVIDDLYAFWGSADENVADWMSLAMMKCGKNIERLDLYIRLGYRTETVKDEFRKLRRLLEHREGERIYDPEALTLISEYVMDTVSWLADPFPVLEAINRCIL